MSPVDPLLSTSVGYFIPHHCVVKGEKENAKIRVVLMGVQKLQMEIL